MNTRILLAAVGLLGFVTIAQAQTPPADAPQNEARVAAANNAVVDQSTTRLVVDADAQAAYEQDMAAYRDALRARHHDAVADARLYDHQQRAYADAMVAWRIQVAACHRGRRAACDAPAPDPAAFW